MKKSWAKMSWMIAGLLVAGFFPALTHAQAETGAQEHESKNMAPMTAPATKTDFQGKFSLRYQVQCHGHKMMPGEYTLLVKTVGEDKMVTFQREGSDVVVKSHPVPPTSAPNEGHSAVLVRHGPGPKTHTLEGVYVEDLKLVLVLDEAGKSAPLDKIFAGVNRIPIT